MVKNRMFKDDEKENIIKLWQQKEMIGLENFVELLVNIRNNENYPPYNIVKASKNVICIEIAVAGFSRSDLNIELNEMQLTVTGSRSSDQKEYIHKGIAKRSFKKSFLIAGGIKVRKAAFNNGLLEVYLEKPDEKDSLINIPIEEEI